MENQTKKWPIFAPFEVVIHNTPTDCWVSFLGKVFNITQLIQQYAGQRCIKPLLAMAGKDIGHWFDERTGDIQYYIQPETGVRLPYCPHGPLPDVSFEVPATAWKPLDNLPWWKDERYIDKNIEMNKTLDENNIPDERDKFTEIGLPQNFYVPSIFLYYIDDLKWAKEDDDDDDKNN